MRVNPSVSGNVQGTQTEGLKKSEATAKPDRARQVEQMAKNQADAEPAGAEISAKGKDFAKAHAVASAVSDIREDKIAELKKRIASGDYQIDNDAIADKMIGEHASF
ncbi:MAG: flagellar biosynthesis anti-sigma factor FlgM [Cryobacterium sp.]|nr:flagellar biosynthesis anti-sigma factor FlgM [Oligoflexia bacterium]